MEESELTRKAIEELMKEMSDYKERESLPMERKINPLGKPNKRFLGRTINSMLTHNKRESDRNHQNCQRKLKELDSKQRKRDYCERYRNHRKESRRRSKSDSAHEIKSSSSDEDQKHKKVKKLKKKKKKKRKKKQKFSSSSSSPDARSSSDSDSSDSSSSSSRSKRKKHKHKKQVKTEEGEEYQHDYYPANDPSYSYYVDPNMAYAAMAYSQMQRVLHQQQLAQQQLVKEELEESVDVLSDLSLTCPDSESSLNISLHSSSAEEDENGIFTFQLSSDDEHAKTKKNKTSKNVVHSNTSLDDDKESVVSHISLESDKSDKSNKPGKANSAQVSEVYLLNTSSSDSELEIVEPKKNESNSAGKTIEVNEKPAEEDSTKEPQVTTVSLVNCADKITEESTDLENDRITQAEVDPDKECQPTSDSISMIDLTDD